MPGNEARRRGLQWHSWGLVGARIAVPLFFLPAFQTLRAEEQTGGLWGEGGLAGQWVEKVPGAGLSQGLSAGSGWGVRFRVWGVTVWLVSVLFQWVGGDKQVSS